MAKILTERKASATAQVFTRSAFVSAEKYITCS
jgi:hypothetical protein